MSINDVIDLLKEAKEHGVQGKRNVIVIDNYTGDEFSIKDITYDDKNVTMIID